MSIPIPPADSTNPVPFSGKLPPRKHTLDKPGQVVHERLSKVPENPSRELAGHRAVRNPPSHARAVPPPHASRVAQPEEEDEDTEGTRVEETNEVLTRKNKHVQEKKRYRPDETADEEDEAGMYLEDKSTPEKAAGIGAGVSLPTSLPRAAEEEDEEEGAGMRLVAESTPGEAAAKGIGVEVPPPSLPRAAETPLPPVRRPIAKNLGEVSSLMPPSPHQRPVSTGIGAGGPSQISPLTSFPGTQNEVLAPTIHEVSLLPPPSVVVQAMTQGSTLTPQQLRALGRKGAQVSVSYVLNFAGRACAYAGIYQAAYHHREYRKMLEAQKPGFFGKLLGKKPPLEAKFTTGVATQKLMQGAASTVLFSFAEGCVQTYFDRQAQPGDGHTTKEGIWKLGLRNVGRALTSAVPRVIADLALVAGLQYLGDQIPLFGSWIKWGAPVLVEIPGHWELLKTAGQFAWAKVEAPQSLALISQGVTKFNQMKDALQQTASSTATLQALPPPTTTTTPPPAPK